MTEGVFVDFIAVITKIYKCHILYCPRETRIIIFLSVPLSFWLVEFVYLSTVIIYSFSPASTVSMAPGRKYISLWLSGTEQYVLKASYCVLP